MNARFSRRRLGTSASLNVATQFPQELAFDPSTCKIVNHQEANAALQRVPEGLELVGPGQGKGVWSRAKSGRSA